MITEAEIVARFGRLEVHVLQRWIAAGWVKPRESGAGFLFDEADVARTHLLCDLSFDMELHDEELAIVLSLIDRLNGTRTMLQALTAAGGKPASAGARRDPGRDARAFGGGRVIPTVIGFDRSFPIAWGIARSRLLLRAVACIAMAAQILGGRHKLPVHLQSPPVNPVQRPNPSFRAVFSI